MVTDRCAELGGQLRDVLAGSRNPDGGWGYYPAKRSRVEPTCWALLALIAEGRPEDRPLVEAGLALLSRWQAPVGLLAEHGLPPNIAFNGLASLCLTAAASKGWGDERVARVAVRLLEAVVGVESTRVSNLFSPARQDSRLLGWPWTSDAFAWVEPTSLCLLALKRAKDEGVGPRGKSRVREAELLLFDRQCVEGGWNYGNSEVFGQELRPYVPPTALALLALGDRAGHPAVGRGLDWLMGRWRSEPSGMAVGLTLLCFVAHRVPSEDLASALVQAYERTRFLDNLSVAALVRLALASRSNGHSVFAP